MLVRLRHPAWEPAVYPLAVDARALPCGGVSLSAWQDAEAARAGLPVRELDATGALPPDATVVCAPDVLFSDATLRALVHEATTRRCVVQACVARGTPTFDAMSPHAPVVDDVLPLPLWAGPVGGLRARVDGDVIDAFEAERVAVVDEADVVTVRTAPYGAPLRVPAGAKLGGRFLHWLHVLDGNLAVLALAQRRRHGTVVRGKNVKVHPSAYVHNSVLEDGVTIEANASVVDAYVGAGVHIADHAVIAQCVLGAGCRTLVDTHLRRVIALPDSTLSNLDLQDVVIGTGVFVTTAVAYFQGQKGVPLVVDGFAVARPVVGGAIGARCRLGSRALLAAGVSLPPGAVVVARPEEALAKIDAQGLGRAAMMFGDRTRDA